jgi:hypothetical protein
MAFLRRQKVQETPRPVDPADTANRVETERQKRLSSGGRTSTFLSQVAAETATASPRATLNGGG